MLPALSAVESILAQETKTVLDIDEQTLLSQPRRIPDLLAHGRLRPAQVPNPHWREDACKACHTGVPSTGSPGLRDQDINRLCRTCHAAISKHSYIHPVGMPAPEGMQARMSEPFRRAIARGGGKVTCITCHDLPMQCLPERARERSRNARFFRGGPYRTRTGLCFQCHDASRYARLNPHDQVAETGVLREDVCLVCHPDDGSLSKARSIDEVGFTVARDALSSMCTRCHPWVPHPGGGFSFAGEEASNHLVKPSSAVLARKRHMERQRAIALPLEPATGRVFCGTCHNPHERGVVKNEEADKGADSEQRLRAQELCIHCHEK